MPIQVDGAFVRAPCPVPSCPACEPNSGSVPKPINESDSSRAGPTLLCNHVRSSTHFSGFRVNQTSPLGSHRPHDVVVRTAVGQIPAPVERLALSFGPSLITGYSRLYAW